MENNQLAKTIIKQIYYLAYYLFLWSYKTCIYSTKIIITSKNSKNLFLSDDLFLLNLKKINFKNSSIYKQSNTFPKL